MRINARRDDRRGDFFAGLQHDSGGAPIFHQDAVYGSLSANLDAGLASGGSDRVRDSTGTSAAETPGTKCAVNLAHVMVKQNIRGARRPNAQKSPDDSRS